MSKAYGMQKKEEWDAAWRKWFERYSRSLPQIGMWIHCNYGSECSTFLEIGAGSARESRYLARYAAQVYCVDYAPAVVEMVNASGPPSNLIAKTMDAFQLDVADRSFDCTFHKGFWVLFASDQDLGRLLREQVRVSDKVALALVHNGRNRRMVADFMERAKNDDLFNIRFFDPRWIQEFVKKSLAAAGVAADVRIRKYGGAGWMYRWPWPVFLSSLRDRVASFIYACLPWSRVESIVVEIRRPTRKVK